MAITWITPTDLGKINTGDISMLSVKAVDSNGADIFYMTTDLPAVLGLSLSSSGNIVGRVRFVTPSASVSFTVTAKISGSSESLPRTFTLAVNAVTSYDNMFIQALPKETDREFFDSLMLDPNFIPYDFLYRPDDYNFGKSSKIIYNHIYGLTAKPVENYTTALEHNHYRKMLTLGPIKVAQARKDNTGDLIYEAVYCEIQDSGVNAQGQSPPQSVPVPFPFRLGNATITSVYPNSLIEMRNEVIKKIGQESTNLPLWMTSKQSSGNVLGFTIAVVLAYCIPGRGDQLAYNITTEWGKRLNAINFEIDRVILDKNGSNHYLIFPKTNILQ